VENRPQHTRRNPARGIGEKSVESLSESSTSPWPHIAELIDYGEITVGVIKPVGCVAVASDEDCTYAMLVRRKGETLFQLLARLDQAIAKALTEDIFTDEINPPPHPKL